MMKFSVIVPVHNAKKYIRKCLESIYCQTYHDYEAIIVVDGKEDSSVGICEEYTKKDSRFHLYVKKNGGSSSARNYGLKVATGEYICFLDSDDTIVPTLLESIYNRIKYEKADVYVYNYQVVGENGLSVFCPKMKEGKFLYLSSKEKFCLLMNLLYFEYAFCVWNKVYQSNVIKTYHIQFPESVKVGEDLNFNMKYFLHCDSICVSNEKLYNYYVRTNSTMNHGTDSVPDLDDFSFLLEDVRKHYKTYAPGFIKRHYPILWYEGMNNQYYKYPQEKVVSSMKKMNNKELVQRGIFTMLFCSGMFVRQYGMTKGLKIIKKNVRYLFELWKKN